MDKLLGYLKILFSKDALASFGRVTSFILAIGGLGLHYYAVFTKQIPETYPGLGLYLGTYITSLMFYALTKISDVQLAKLANKAIDNESQKHE